MAVRTRTDPQGRTRYDIEFQQRGRRVLERCPPGTTQKQAREREILLRRETYETDTLGHAPELLLDDLIQQWLATRPHKHHRNAVNKANQLLPFVNGRKVSEAIDAAKSAVASWSVTPELDSADGKGSAKTPRTLASATINRRLAILKAALTWHGREDLSRKIKLRRENNAREVYLTKAEVLRLARAASDRKLRAAIMLLAYSGLRPSELLAQRGNSSRTDSLWVPMSKNGRPRVVPLPLRARHWLRALPLGMSYDQLYKGFGRARKKAGFGAEVVLYTLRHSYASWLVNRDVSLKKVAELLGHTTIQITAKHYSHLYTNALEDAVADL